MPLNDNVSGITTLFPHLLKKTESRRDHEEGDELDSQEEASPEETKSREVELGQRVGLLLLQSFPIGGATDIVFVTLSSIAVGTAIVWCGGCCAMPDTALTSCCSGGGPRQPWSSGLAPVLRFHSSVPLSHSSPSLIGLLASMDVKQQNLAHTPTYCRILWKLDR